MCSQVSWIIHIELHFFVKYFNVKRSTLGWEENICLQESTFRLELDFITSFQTINETDLQKRDETAYFLFINKIYLRVCNYPTLISQRAFVQVAA